MKCFMEELESLFLHSFALRTMISEGSGLQLPEIGGGQRKLKRKQS